MKKLQFRLPLVFFFLLICAVRPVVAQSGTFPNGSAEGTAQMSRNVRPAEIPNVSIQITEPRSGQEVAFSVRLLVILTVLTLAPSLLILVTCFLRFSIVLDFIVLFLPILYLPRLDL